MYITPDIDLYNDELNLAFKAGKHYWTESTVLDHCTSMRGDESSDMPHILGTWHQYFREVKDSERITGSSVSQLTSIGYIEDIIAQLKKDNEIVLERAINNVHDMFSSQKLFESDIQKEIQQDIDDIESGRKTIKEIRLKRGLKPLEPVKTVSYKDKPKKVDKSIGSKYERWKPSYHKYYWWLDSTGCAYTCNYDSELENRYSMFNVFKTKEEAEKERDIRQVWYELREFAKVRNHCQIKEGEGYAAELYGVKFKWIPDWRDAQEHFGDRLKLLEEL